jgi:hypothetical protein
MFISIVNRTNIKGVENFPDLSRNVMQMTCLSENCHQFNIKMAIAIRLTFSAFSLYAQIRRNAAPVCNECHLIVQLTNSKQLQLDFIVKLFDPVEVVAP